MAKPSEIPQGVESRIPRLDLYKRTDYSGFLSPKIAARVDGVIDYVRGLNDRRDWFRTRTFHQLDEIVPEVQSLANRLVSARLPFGETTITLNSPIYSIDDFVQNHARAAERELGFNFARNAAGEEVDGDNTKKVAWHQAQLAALGIVNQGIYTSQPPAELISIGYDLLSAGFAAGFAAEWEVVSDLSPFQGIENPGMIMLEIYGLGSTRINEFLVNGERKLVLDFPVLDGDLRGLGCWVDGDGQIEYFHKWGQWCKDIVPLLGSDADTSSRFIELLPIKQPAGKLKPKKPYIIQPPY